MSYVLKIVDLAGYPVEPFGAYVSDAWVRTYDPEGYDGRGTLILTWDLDEALTFDTPEDAHALWTAVPSNRPLRADGLPNRPLTQLSVEIEKVL